MEEHNNKITEAGLELSDAIKRYVAYKRTGWEGWHVRDTEEEKDERDKEFRREVIQPRIDKLKWLLCLKIVSPNLFEISGEEDIQNPENHENQPNQREKTQGAGIV